MDILEHNEVVRFERGRRGTLVNARKMHDRIEPVLPEHRLYRARIEKIHLAVRRRYDIESLAIPFYKGFADKTASARYQNFHKRMLLYRIVSDLHQLGLYDDFNSTVLLNASVSTASRAKYPMRKN